jgi:hypothetical protein
MREKRPFSPPLTGGSSLLVIFAVLCLTIFALLGLATVQADGRLSDKTAQAVTDYYAADTQAETILAQLRQGQVPEGVTAEGDTYTYSVPVGDTQALEVTLTRQSDGSFVIRQWQTRSTTDWVPGEDLGVWLGD